MYYIYVCIHMYVFILVYMPIHQKMPSCDIYIYIYIIYLYIIYITNLFLCPLSLVFFIPASRESGVPAH